MLGVTEITARSVKNDDLLFGELHPLFPPDFRQYLGVMP